MDISKNLHAKLDTLIKKIQLPNTLTKNEVLLEDNKEVFKPSIQEEDDNVNKPVQTFNKSADLKLARALEDTYYTPPPTEEDEESPYAFHIKYPTKSDIQGTDQDVAHQAGDAFHTQGVFNNSVKDSFTEASDYRFKDFVTKRITSAYHGAFLAGRKFNLNSRLNDSKLKSGRTHDVKLHRKNLPPPPQSIRDLNTHPLRDQFQEAQRAHLQSHHQMRSFQETEKKHAKGQQVLSSMWVFVYKMDKHGFLQKYKARLVVCGNQQAPEDLPTRATTLASTTFRTLIAITAKFDLKTTQIDAVNAFVHCDLNKVVYIKLPPGFNKGKIDKVLRLRKALYGL